MQTRNKRFKDKRCQKVSLLPAIKIYKAITNNIANSIYSYFTFKDIPYELGREPPLRLP